MVTTLKPVDIVIVGFGWTGGILAKELASTGLKIVALERGGPRTTDPDFLEPRKDDELRYANRNDLMQDVTRETLTFRNNASQTALPMRQLGSFLPGEGVGGAGAHWNGITLRWSDWDHEPRKHTLERYGAKAMPEDMLLADWPISYDDLEPYYDRFEKLCGTSGKAGNLRGQKIDGGNVFESPRQNEYPLPPLKRSQALVMYEKAARDLGYHPYPIPASNASEPYRNPDGVAFGACHYCGFCERFGCEVNAKASPHFTVVPLAMKNPDFELRTNARVLKVNLDGAKKRAKSVTYMDARGREFEQPAELIVMAAYALSNVHLMLVSGMGTPYDPKTGKGVIGKNYAYQIGGGATAFFGKDTYLHPYMAAGALGTMIDDFNAGNFDSLAKGFIGGGMLGIIQTNGRPIGFHPTPPGTPRWGSKWKEAVVRYYERATNIGNTGSVLPYKQNYLDLDPTYKDAFGRPLLRMTFDYQANEIAQSNHNADRAVELAHAMGAETVARAMPAIPYSIVPYQSTHNTGGAIMGRDPKTSAVNRYHQMWDLPNVFVTGAATLPQNAGRAPTAPVGALAYWMADAIKNRYLKNPGALVHA